MIFTGREKKFSIVLVVLCLQYYGLSASPIKVQDEKDFKVAASKESTAFNGGFKEYKAGDDGDEVGYHKKQSSKGDDGYQHYENFHNKDGDAYGYEKHESFGDGNKHDEDSGGHSSSYSSNDDDGGDHSSHYEEGDADDGDNTEDSNDGEHSLDYTKHDAHEEEDEDASEPASYQVNEETNEDKENHDDNGSDGGNVNESSEDKRNSVSVEKEHSTYKNDKSVEVSFGNGNKDVGEKQSLSGGGSLQHFGNGGFESIIYHTDDIIKPSKNDEQKSGKVLEQFQVLHTDSPKGVRKSKSSKNKAAYTEGINYDYDPPVSYTSESDKDAYYL